MKIIQIENKDNKKVLIHFDNNQKLLISKEVVYQTGLRKADELSDEQIKDLLEQEIKFNLKQKALSFLSRRIHSKRELFDKLRRHSSDLIFIEECLSDLEKNGLVDDYYFTELFIQEKIRLKKWSRSKLKLELLKRGVKKETIEEYLEKLFDTNQEKNKAIELLRKKLNQIKTRTKDKKILYQKLFMYLNSKGYDYELSSEIIRNELNINDEPSVWFYKILSFSLNNISFKPSLSTNLIASSNLYHLRFL